MSKKNYAGIIFYSVKITSLIFFLTACNGKIPHDIHKGLAGHWTLSGNTGDISGNGRDAIVLGDIDTMVKGPDGQAGSAILFNGLNSCLEIKSGRLFNPGKNDFSLSVWVKTGDDNDDVPGDIISQYDTSLHRGFHLSLKSNAVTTSQANALQVHFGIDSNHMSEWSDCGRPGNALCAFSLASFNGSLYAGTTEAGKDESGHVYRYAGERQWIDCGSPDKSNSVMALAVFNGKLYAGTGKYRLAGSALPESENLNPGGNIFRYEGDKNWTDCGKLPEAESIGGMIVYRGDLYASSLYRPAGFYRYDGKKSWIDCGTPGGKRVVALAVYNGFIYASSYDGGFVYRYDGNGWTDCGQLGNNTQTYSFAVYKGRLYVGTWPSGRVYSFGDINRWTDAGRLGNELEVMGMLVHNGRMIAGTLPLAEVYFFRGDTLWEKIVRLDHTRDVKYRRAWTMAEHDGKVFCSTLPSGKIFSYESGRNVLSTNPVTPGWHHLAAVKSEDRLSLFIDGKKLAQSEPFDPDMFDLDNQMPLKIGFGSNDYFNGSMANIRLYNRALSSREIRYLSDIKSFGHP
jgi:hypothetical protein